MVVKLKQKDMKWILLAHLLWLPFCNQAQSDPLRDKLNTIFANINVSQIQTGFLKEYGAPLVSLEAFRGQLTDSNMVTINVWRHIYATIYSSRIQGTNPLGGLSGVNTAIGQVEESSNGAIPIPIIFAEYNAIRLDAIELNLLYVQNNQLFDVPGRTGSPYLTKHVYAAAPSIGYADTGSPSFIFKQELFYNASNKVVSSLNVDFNDGQGYLTASWNAALTANYSSKGTKQIKIKIQFTDGTIYQCYSFVDITQTSNGQQRYQDPSQLVYFPPNPNHNSGLVSLRYSSMNSSSPKKIKKPLIVVEGFDVSSIAPSLQKNFGYSDFIDMLNVIRTEYDLSQQLDDVAGYDLIFLNFTDGTDDIVRNAALLKEVIIWVNNEKAGIPGNQPNVVLGISMGGLVARFALADMIKYGPAPQTRMLFTLDSPHRGANVPLGIQAMTRSLNNAKIILDINVRDLVPDIQKANLILDAPASQQMLISRAINGTGSYALNSFLEGDYHNMITFPVSGPQPAYAVEAISLGSQCGNQVLTPYQELVRISGGINFFLPFILISNLGLQTEIIANALPVMGNSQRISKVRFWFHYTILIFIDVEVDLTNDSFYSPSTLLPWDGAPGGTRGVQDNLLAGNPTVGGGFSQFYYPHSGVQLYQGSFCFVPAVSALDVTTIDAGALSAPYTGGVSNSYQPRVANFIAQERVGTSNVYNEAHFRFTARNAEWMFREMENPSGNLLNCSSECAPNYSAGISAPQFLCYGSPQNAVLGGTFPASATYTWSTGPSAYFSTSSGTGRTASLNINNPSYTGPVGVTFQVLGLCQPVFSISTNIWAGPPSGQINGPTEVYPDQVYVYEAGPNGNPYAFQWIIDGSGFNWGCCDNQPTVQVYWSGSGTEGNVNLISTNGCGSTYSTLPVTITIEGGCNPCQIVTPYPNPSNDELAVSIEDLSPKKEFVGPYEISLYDLSGLNVFKAVTKKSTFHIDTRQLKSGLYFLRVVNGKGISASKQVQIIH